MQDESPLIRGSRLRRTSSCSAIILVFRIRGTGILLPRLYYIPYKEAGQYKSTVYNKSAQQKSPPQNAMGRNVFAWSPFIFPEQSDCVIPRRRAYPLSLRSSLCLPPRLIFRLLFCLLFRLFFRLHPFLCLFFRPLFRPCSFPSSSDLPSS